MLREAQGLPKLPTLKEERAANKIMRMASEGGFTTESETDFLSNVNDLKQTHPIDLAPNAPSRITSPPNRFPIMRIAEWLNCFRPTSMNPPIRLLC
jgi:hypothetical protein